MKNYVNILKQADIFYGLTDDQLALIADTCQEHAYKKGDEILVEGGASDELYIIAQGEVTILVNPDLVSDTPSESEPVPVATLGRGQSFGEIALVDRGLRSASVRSAQDNTRLLVIERGAMIQLCELYPMLGYRLMYNMAADLALKMRLVDLRTREGWLYRPSKNLS